jgi:hypothetical protein
MAIGSVVGRERLEDLAQAQKAKVPATEMYLRFRDALGHTQCAEIQKLKFGRSYRLYDPEEQKAFHAAGCYADDGCPQVCGTATRIAADIVLRLRENA